jgi:hypothetical protein
MQAFAGLMLLEPLKLVRRADGQSVSVGSTDASASLAARVGVSDRRAQRGYRFG